ncbi:MAG: hypothetical protein Q4D96_14800 [Propionibacteriaceae bacterium]|nr:hypothetical protein [Propionibacteriaceae bacterium]
MKHVTVLAVLTTAMLLGCAPKQEQPREPLIPPPTTYSIPTPTAPQSYTPVKTPEQQAAEEVVAEYFRLKNIVKQDPEADMEPLYAIVVGDLLENELALLEQYREDHVVQSGEFTFAIQGSRRQQDGTVQVAACTDASTIDLVDQDTGESILDPNRPFIKQWKIQTRQVGETWKVADLNTQDAEQCAP